MQAETEAYEEELLSEPECVVSSAMRKRFFSEAAPLQSTEFAFFRPRERQLTTTHTGEPMKC